MLYKESDDDLLSHARCTLSLARSRFTVLFEMGRSGANLLWSSDITVVGIRCGSGLTELPPLADAFWRSKVLVFDCIRESETHLHVT